MPLAKFVDAVRRIKLLEVRREIIKVQELYDDFFYHFLTLNPGDSEVDYFQSKVTGTGLAARRTRANFAGDESLVKEKLLVEVHAMFALPIGRPITQEEANSLYDNGQYLWMNDDSVASRGNLRFTLGGPSFKGLVGGGNVSPQIFAEVAQGEFANVRRFAIPRVVVGGRTTEMKFEWPEAAHLELTEPLLFGPILYGTVCKPLQAIPELEKGMGEQEGGIY